MCCFLAIHPRAAWRGCPLEIAGSFRNCVPSLPQHAPDHLSPSTAQAAVRCIDNLLILPTFFARNRELSFTFDRGGKTIELARKCISIRYAFSFYHASCSAQLKLNRTLHAERVVSPERTAVTDNFEWRAVFCTCRN